MVEQLDAENDFFSNKKVAKSVAKNLLRNKAASKGKTEQMFEAIFIKHIFCFSNFFVFHKKSFSCHRHKLAWNSAETFQKFFCRGSKPGPKLGCFIRGGRSCSKMISFEIFDGLLLIKPKMTRTVTKNLWVSYLKKIIKVFVTCLLDTNCQMVGSGFQRGRL